MAGKWVDFKTIKETVKLEDVLVHYGLLSVLKQTAQGFKGPCPVHKGKHPNQFHVDTQKNRWNCFGGCDMGRFEGHVIGFVAAMEGVGLREAALMLAEWYGLSMERPDHPAQRKSGGRPAKGETSSSSAAAPAARRAVSAAAPEPASAAPEVVGRAADAPEEPENKELTFELKNLSPDHSFFAERRIAPETVNLFGLGLCSRGLMKDRIVFPMHRHDGKLIGYLGRTVREITSENPKWLLPPGLVKPKVLFNFHRVVGFADTVIIVEGPLDLVAVHQAGFQNVVALLGKELLAEPSFSYDQVRLIVQNFSRVVLLLDGDADGQAAAVEIAGRLAPFLWVRSAVLPAGQDPGDVEPGLLRQILSF
jgi:DNA primase